MKRALPKRWAVRFALSVNPVTPSLLQSWSPARSNLKLPTVPKLGSRSSGADEEPAAVMTGRLSAATVAQVDAMIESGPVSFMEGVLYGELAS